MELNEVINKRKSIRKYINKNVPENMIPSIQIYPFILPLGST